MRTVYIIVAALLLKISQLDGTFARAIADNPQATMTELNVEKGLTFVKREHQVPFGIDFVGCRDWTDPNGMNCNTDEGDTLCTEQRPVLCVKVDNSPRPAYFVYGSGAAMPPEFYAGWNHGHIATTLPVAGSSFSTKADVDAYCAQAFGAGWRLATFHDAMYISGMNGTIYAGDSWTANTALMQTGGWHYYSYGDVRNDMRFWVHIRDRPANCWSN
ncbi:unnamed protein product [Rotaria sordida]|uniref:Uncharacterized protein n=1 Tax=Rotaria sordida TaxID=392033 RepID=A0A814V708_9BILA|nr:unnamed protein product [Rotaria sordida]CAF1284758.1 unnamed protein product [Rotaria sordida]CAF1362077.1 unnamed protein product [Rotaria sordida]CAF1378646.1 unnamed protein product [Rotaria sordida]CAF1562564.1 unnamed protein product [Rotaria sordida]